MNKHLRYMVILLITCVLTSCSTQINFSEYIDKNKPLEMMIMKYDSLSQNTKLIKLSIPANSDKYKRLIEWAEKNKSGWQSTPASYISEICISQGDFRLLYTPRSSGVVIGFSDVDKQPKQYSKSIMAGELDFLGEG